MLRQTITSRRLSGFPRSLKVFKSFEICNYEFKALKVLEFYLRSLKVLEFWVLIFFFMRPTFTRAYNMLYNTSIRTVTVVNRKSWQSIAIIPSEYCLSHYYGRPQLSRGGGVAIINHNSIHHTAISIPSFSSFECIGSVITSSNSSFKLFVVY